MIKDQSDSEIGNLLPPFRSAARDLLYAPDRIAHTTACTGWNEK